MPWSLCKSRRGRPGIIATAGQYCPNRDCDYYQVRDESLTHRSRRGRFRYRTPAIAAGVGYRRFGVSELLLMPV
jgi:hypothetical protein